MFYATCHKVFDLGNIRYCDVYIVRSHLWVRPPQAVRLLHIIMAEGKELGDRRPAIADNIYSGNLVHTNLDRLTYVPLNVTKFWEIPRSH